MHFKKTMLTLTDIPIKGELPFITLHMGVKYPPFQKNLRAQISNFHTTAVLCKVSPKTYNSLIRELHGLVICYYKGFLALPSICFSPTLKRQFLSGSVPELAILSGQTDRFHQ